MADTSLKLVSNGDSNQEVREHVRSFVAFRHMVVFAALHIALTLACVALAFIGHIKLLAFLLWVAGTLSMIAVLAVHSTGGMQEFARPRNYKQSH